MMRWLWRTAGRAAVCWVLVCSGGVLPVFGDSGSPDAIKLRVWPSELTEPAHAPIRFKIALENATASDAYVQISFIPKLASGRTNASRSGLKFRCLNVDTGVETPLVRPQGDGGPGLRTCEILGYSFLGRIVDMSHYCRFKPGNYSLVLWADTTHGHSTGRSGIRLWRGVTNKVTITIHITQ